MWASVFVSELPKFSKNPAKSMQSDSPSPYFFSLNYLTDVVYSYSLSKSSVCLRTMCLPLLHNHNRGVKFKKLTTDRTLLSNLQPIKYGCDVSQKS